MVAAARYDIAVENIVNSTATTINLWGIANTHKAALHSDAPVQATDDELADLTQPTGTGYTAGGEDTANNGTRATNVVNVAATDVVWTASAADWTAFQYVSVHDDTSTTDELVCSWDYGSSVTLGNGETFTWDVTTNYITVTFT